MFFFLSVIKFFTETLYIKHLSTVSKSQSLSSFTLLDFVPSVAFTIVFTAESLNPFARTLVE